MDLNQFIAWQQAGKRRSVTITLGDPANKTYTRFWAYDYDLEVGQSVKSVDEIDLFAAKELELKRRIAELENLKAEVAQ